MLGQAVTRGERHRRRCLNGAGQSFFERPPHHRRRVRVPGIVEVESRSLRVRAEAAGESRSLRWWRR